MTAELRERRLFAWWGLVGTLTVLAFLTEASENERPDDLLYRYELAFAGLVFYGVILAIALLIARNDARDLFALRRPASWLRAGGISVAALISIFILGAALERVFHAGEEQGLDPTGWQPDRAAAYAVNFLVVAGVTPVVEELVFRGLGFSLLRPFGSVAAVLITGITFGLAHGILVGVPIFTMIGILLAIVRSRTDSVYPGIGIHAAFNGLQLIAAVTVAS